MAIINSYPKDVNIQDRDAWIGTDSFNRQTKQYTADGVAKYLNVKGKISISSQMSFQFKILNAGPGQFYGPNDSTNMTDVSSLLMSIYDLSGQNVVEFMSYLVGNDILISDQLDASVFGHYKIKSYTSDGQFYRLLIDNIGGNGNIQDKGFFDLAVFTLSSSVSPTFTFDQLQPSATWNIQHNLGKFPSVSVVNDNDILMYGNTEYIDNNNITITFSGGFSGKAYLN